MNDVLPGGKFILSLAVCGLMGMGAPSASDGEAAASDDISAVTYLTQHDYASLEKRYGNLVEQYKSGKIDDEAVDKAFDKLARNSTDGQEAQFDGWVERYPESYVALTARGCYLRAKAWRIRGGKYAAETTSEQIAGFREYMQKARADLTKSLTLDDKPIVGHLTLITIAGAIDGPIAARKMRDSALAVDPQSYVAHLRYLTYVLPKWGGNPDLMAKARADALASRMSDRNKVRYQANFDFFIADELERTDRAGDALKHYWRSYREAVGDESDAALTRGASLANRTRRFEEAVKFLDEIIAARRGNEVWAHSLRGAIYEVQFNQMGKAFDDYSVAAGAGDSWTENKLGVWYYNGTYVSRDTEMAKKYWQRAAEKGNRSAIDNLKRFERRPSPTIDAK